MSTLQIINQWDCVLSVFLPATPAGVNQHLSGTPDQHNMNHTSLTDVLEDDGAGYRTETPNHRCVEVDGDVNRGPLRGGDVIPQKSVLPSSHKHDICGEIVSEHTVRPRVNKSTHSSPKYNWLAGGEHPPPPAPCSCQCIILFLHSVEFVVVCLASECGFVWCVSLWLYS